MYVNVISQQIQYVVTQQNIGKIQILPNGSTR